MFTVLGMWGVLALVVWGAVCIFIGYHWPKRGGIVPTCEGCGRYTDGIYCYACHHEGVE